MKPLVVRPQEEHEESPVLEQAPRGRSGEGARSALEQLIRQERTRVLHDAGEPPADRSPQ